MGLFDFFKKKRDNSSESTMNISTECQTQNWECGKTPELTDIARFVVEKQECNAAAIQRHFGIGYNAVGNFISQLQQASIIDYNKKVLATNSNEIEALLEKKNNSTQDEPRTISVVVDSNNYQQDNLMSIKELTDYDCYVIFDTETSGLYPNYGHEILQIGAVKYDTVTGNKVDSLSLLIKPSPQCVIEQAALRVNGLNVQKLKKDGVDRKEAIQCFISFIGNCPLLAYNSPFDMRFLIATCKAVGISVPQNKVLDVLALVRRLSLPTCNNKLATVSEHFGYSSTNYHEAVSDCEATNFVLRKICFDEKGNVVEDSADDMHLNLHKNGVELDSYITDMLVEVDVFSRLTGELLYTKTIKECLDMGTSLRYGSIQTSMNEEKWVGDYGVRRHSDGITALTPDPAYGKRLIDVFSRSTGEFLFTKTLEECATLSGKLSKNMIAQAISDKTFAGNYGFRDHNDGISQIERDFSFGKRMIDAYNKEGEFLKRFNDVADIVSEYGFAGESPINTMLRLEKKSYNLNGYVFMYASTETPIEKIEPVLITKEAKRPIYVYDLKGKLLGVFTKAAAIEAQYNLRAEGIRRCLSGGKPQYNGYIFRYCETTLSEEELVAAKENFAYREISQVQD